LGRGRSCFGSAHTTLYSVTFTVPNEKNRYTANMVIDVLCNTVQSSIDTIMKHYPAATIVSVNKVTKGRKVILGVDVDLFGLMPQPREE
jgi:hypothetical protein